MSVKTPSAVVAFENVPADADDPVVDVYVNSEKVSSGGGDDRLTIIELDNDMKADISINEIKSIIADKKAVSFLYVSNEYNSNLAISSISLDHVSIAAYITIDEESATSTVYQADPATPDTKPIQFYEPGD